LLPDDEFLRAFFGLTLANSEFRHRDHLRLAWLAEFLAAFPLLLDKNTPLRHWSRESMFGAEARAAWQDPDLVALPF
jgi:hypothetical protein